MLRMQEMLFYNSLRFNGEANSPDLPEMVAPLPLAELLSCGPSESPLLHDTPAIARMPEISD